MGLPGTRHGQSLDTETVLHEDSVMKNVTITLEEEVWRWTRIQAAREDTSVARMVGQLLAARMRQQQAYEASMAQFLAREPRQLKRSGAYPPREAVHDRADLR